MAFLPWVFPRFELLQPTTQWLMFRPLPGTDARHEENPVHPGPSFCSLDGASKGLVEGFASLDEPG